MLKTLVSAVLVLAAAAAIENAPDLAAYFEKREM